MLPRHLTVERTSWRSRRTPPRLPGSGRSSRRVRPARRPWPRHRWHRCLHPGYCPPSPGQDSAEAPLSASSHSAIAALSRSSVGSLAVIDVNWAWLMTYARTGALVTTVAVAGPRSSIRVRDLATSKTHTRTRACARSSVEDRLHAGPAPGRRRPLRLAPAGRRLGLEQRRPDHGRRRSAPGRDPLRPAPHAGHISLVHDIALASSRQGPPCCRRAPPATQSLSESRAANVVPARRALGTSLT